MNGWWHSTLRAHTNIVIATTRLGDLEAAEVHTLEVFKAIDRPSFLDLRELLGEFKRHQSNKQVQNLYERVRSHIETQ